MTLFHLSPRPPGPGRQPCRYFKKYTKYRYINTNAYVIYVYKYIYAHAHTAGSEHGQRARPRERSATRIESPCARRFARRKQRRMLASGLCCGAPGFRPLRVAAVARAALPRVGAGLSCPRASCSSSMARRQHERPPPQGASPSLLPPRQRSQSWRGPRSQKPGGLGEIGGGIRRGVPR